MAKVVKGYGNSVWNSFKRVKPCSYFALVLFAAFLWFVSIIWQVNQACSALDIDKVKWATVNHLLPLSGTITFQNKDGSSETFKMHPYESVEEYLA